MNSIGNRKHRKEGTVIRLVHKGAACARIVIPKSPLPVERHAADELRAFLHRMSGAMLPVVDRPSSHETNIFLGSAAPQQGEISERLLGFDGYILRTTGKDLILAGIKPYSCLYAVYHLLERHLGCGFFQDGDQVPQRKTVEVSALNEVEKPRFDWRLYAFFHIPVYSGMRWFNWQEWKHYFDWMVKKRFNMLEPNHIDDRIGIAALAAGKLGVKIELTDWQKEQLRLFRRLFDYARMCGIRIIYQTDFAKQNLWHEPGSMAAIDRAQTEEFIRRYKEQTGHKIRTVDYKWCGMDQLMMDPRDPAAQKFIAACIEAICEQLGTDHLYLLTMVSEGHFESNDLDELNRIVYSMLMDMIKTVRAADPEASFHVRPPFPYAKTFRAQQRAVRDAGFPVAGEGWLNLEARLHNFKINDYFWGLPWFCGMVVGCGKHTYPWGNIQVCIDNARAVASDPKADNCRGFFIASETAFNNYLMAELFCELAWNPAEVERDEFLRRWTIARYGPDAAERLTPVTEAAADTLLSCTNMDMTNRPLYQDLRGGYLPGLTARSVKRTMSYLPTLRMIIEGLLAEHNQLKDSPMYRYDLVQYGLAYLGALFNDRLARARKALRARDNETFEKYAAGVEEVMHFIAKYASAHPQFRLKTHDDRARRWPEILPGYDNAETNWVIFTATTAYKNWDILLDYMAQDHAELVEHYYWPRVALYLQKMRELLEEGKDISGRLVSRGTNDDLPFRISDWATPQGLLPWSPYGPTCEPELTGEDMELAHKIILGGSVSGKFDFYEGPMKPLVQELLDRFGVPEDLEEILTEPDPTDLAFEKQSLRNRPGDVVDGFQTPGLVEQVQVPEELNYVVSVVKTGAAYTLMRGEVATYRVTVSDWLRLTRREDEKSERGDHSVAVFEFEFEGKHWLLRYDPGSEQTFAALSIEMKGDTK